MTIKVTLCSIRSLYLNWSEWNTKKKTTTKQHSVQSFWTRQQINWVRGFAFFLVQNELLWVRCYTYIIHERTDYSHLFIWLRLSASEHWKAILQVCRTELWFSFSLELIFKETYKYGNCKIFFFVYLLRRQVKRRMS